MTLTKGAGSNQSYYSNGMRSLKIQDTESPGEKLSMRKNGYHPPPPPKKKKSADSHNYYKNQTLRLIREAHRISGLDKHIPKICDLNS